MLRRNFNLLQVCLLLVLAIVPYLAFAQGASVVTVSGVITSAEDKQPLIGVTVVTDKDTSILGSNDIKGKANSLIYAENGLFIFNLAVWKSINGKS